jgi:hypothetical protein
MPVLRTSEIISNTRYHDLTVNCYVMLRDGIGYEEFQRRGEVGRKSRFEHSFIAQTAAAARLSNQSRMNGQHIQFVWKLHCG